jgi:mycothiol system anti-sigma-R factor
MLDCTSLARLVTSYVDGELAPVDRTPLEAHLRACPRCRARVGAEQAVRELLQERRGALCGRPAPAALRSRCAASIASCRESRRGFDHQTSWRARFAPLAAAAVLVLVVGGAFVYQATARSSRVMAAELAADHVKCFAMNAVLGTHESADVVQADMASGFSWRMRLPGQPEREQLDLVGSRPCLYGEGKIAHIMYRHQGRPVSLFMLPHTERREEVVEVFGHQCVIWTGDDRTFVLVSPEPRPDVERLAAFVHASLE